MLLGVLQFSRPPAMDSCFPGIPRPQARSEWLLVTASDTMLFCYVGA
jgi:hypothetical protein